jgi:hypothetical protein
MNYKNAFSINIKYWKYSMLKAISRAALLTIIIVALGFALWFNPLYTLLTLAIVVIFAWLTFMLYIDPPDDWT